MKLLYFFTLLLCSHALASEDLLKSSARDLKAPMVRPFITDDARVVGHRLGQVESWLRVERSNAQLWTLGAIGPRNDLEFTMGALLGYEASESGRLEHSYALPLLQAKYLVRPYAHGQGPGLALVAGTFLPFGTGAFQPPGYGAFSFATVSQCVGRKEDLLLHLNLGANYLYIDNENTLIPTWGLGSQVRFLGGWHWVGEVFSGDPYIPGSGISYQTGLRYFMSDKLQLDATVGEGLAGDKVLPFWTSAGVRWVWGW